jgi:recombination protein RecA
MASRQSLKVDKLFAELQKTYGDKSVMMASDIKPYEVVSSGSLGLDYAIGIGGFPMNRVVEIAGAEGTGKTTLVLHTVNNVLKQYPNHVCLYIDIENRLTPDWVANFVESQDRVIVVKPDMMEEGTDMYVEALKSDLVKIAVLDSIGGAPSQRVVNKSAMIGDMGGNSIAVGRFSRFAQTLSGKHECLTIGINQVRDDMEGYKRLITPGGHAWKHASSLRIELKKGKEKVFDKVDGEEFQVGYPVIAKIHKNSLAAPGRAARYWFYNVPSKYGFGVDSVDELSNLALLTSVIKQPAAGTFKHVTFPDGKIRGRASVLDFIKDHPAESAIIQAEVLDLLKTTHVKGIASQFDVETGEGGESINDFGSESDLIGEE